MNCRAEESYRKFYRHFSVQIWARYTSTEHLATITDRRGCVLEALCTILLASFKYATRQTNPCTPLLAQTN